MAPIVPRNCWHEIPGFIWAHAWQSLLHARVASAKAPSTVTGEELRAWACGQFVMSLPTRSRVEHLKSRVALGDLAAANELLALTDLVVDLAAEVCQARRDMAGELAIELANRLAELRESGGECPACREAEARALLERLRKLAIE